MSKAQFSDRSVKFAIQEFITKSDNIQSEVSFGQSVVKITQSSEASYQSFHSQDVNRVLPDDVDEWTTDELYDYLTDDVELPDV